MHLCFSNFRQGKNLINDAKTWKEATQASQNNVTNFKGGRAQVLIIQKCKALRMSFLSLYRKQNYIPSIVLAGKTNIILHY